MSQTAGVVALLFTDLVGSTEVLDRLGDDVAEELRQAHFLLLRQAVAETGGTEVKSLGDGLMVSFESPVQALECAVRMQRAIADHNRAQPGRMLQVRVGVHVGEPLRDEDDFHGTTVVVAKRLCDQASGGQILASDIVSALVGKRGDFRFRSAGPLKLKGLADLTAAVTVEWRESRWSSEPAPRSPPRVGRSLEGRCEKRVARRSSGSNSAPIPPLASCGPAEPDGADVTDWDPRFGISRERSGALRAAATRHGGRSRT